MVEIAPPGDVAGILDVLNMHGYEAYAVGGCIRDAVMGREPKDWDIATDARPEEVGRLFEKTVDTGIKHGTVTVVIGNRNYEVTTFRIDGRYTDSRHPEKVEFTSRIGDDLRRRDFTVNAMAWNPQKGIIDPFGGMRDISGRIIRTVGKPSDRFGEDALRMLRAIRFAATLGFEIEADTLEGIRQNSSLIRRISAERIREELTGILVSDDPMRFMLLMDTGLLRHIMPELDSRLGPNSDRTGHDSLSETGKHILRSVAAAEADVCLRWAMLLHDAGRCTDAENFEGLSDAHGSKDHKDYEECGRSGDPGAADALKTADTILGRLKFDNRNRSRILRIIRYLGMETEPERSAVARAVLEVGRDMFGDLLKAKRAHIAASMHRCGSIVSSVIPGVSRRPDRMKSIKGGQYRDTDDLNTTTGRHYEDDGRNIAEDLYQLEKIETVFRSLLEGGYCLSLKELKINGDDLKRLGFREGAEMGRMLDHLLDRVIDEPELNRKEALEKLALEYLHKKRISSQQTGET